MYFSNSFFIRKKSLSFLLVFLFFKKIIFFFLLYFISKLSSLLIFKNKNSFYIYGYPSENDFDSLYLKQLNAESFNEELNSKHSCINRQLRLAKYLNINSYQLPLTLHGNISYPLHPDEIITNINYDKSSKNHVFSLATQEFKVENKENATKRNKSQVEKLSTENSDNSSDNSFDTSSSDTSSSSYSSSFSSSLVDNNTLLNRTTNINSLENFTFSSPFSTSSVFPLSMHFKDKVYPSMLEKGNLKREKTNQTENTDNVLLRVLLKNGMKSVFRLKVIRIHPDFAKPWLVSRDLYSSGTAFAIDDRKILTNAHVVTFAHTIFVERHGDPRLYNAKLDVIAHEIDLAILTVNDDEFWKDVVPFHMPKSSCYSSCSCGKKQENVSEYCNFACQEKQGRVEEGEEKVVESDTAGGDQQRSSCSTGSEDPSNCNQSSRNEEIDSLKNTQKTINANKVINTNNNPTYENDTKCIIQDTLDIPNVLDVVLVMGYPVGGTSISITKGVVNRVEVGTYYHSNHKFLLIQIDAASNRGNSGGPVLNMQGEVIGVVFQGITNAQSVGYVIPVPIIYHLLNDVRKHNKYTGIADLGVFMTPLRNPSLKKYLNIYKEKVRDKLNENNIITNTNYLGCVVTNVNERNIKNYFKTLQEVKKEESGSRNDKEDSVDDNIRGNEYFQKFSEKKKFNETNKNLLLNVSFSLFRPKITQLNKNISNPHVPTENLSSLQTNKQNNDEYEQIFKKDYTLFYDEKSQTENQDELIFKQKQIGLKVGDIIVSFDGKVIGEDCTVQFRESDRLSMHYLLTGRYENSTVLLTVIRNKNVIDVIAPLSVNKFVVPIHNWNSQARYIIFGGFVFVELNKSFVLDAPCDAESKWSIAAAAKKFSTVWKNDELEEAVVLSVVLSNHLTKGYEYENVQLISVNGIKVKNLRHLYDLLNMKFCVEYVRKQFNMIAEINIDSNYFNQMADSKDKESDLESNGEEFVTFVFDGIYDIVVMDRIEAIKTLPKILLTHHIASPVSFGV